MFALINVGERSGSGLCDDYNILEENGFKRPELLETIDPARVTLTLHIDGNDENNDGNLDGNDGNLTSNETMVLNIILEEPALLAVKIGAEVALCRTGIAFP